MKFLYYTVLLLFSVTYTFGQVWINQVNPSPGVLFSVYAYDANVAWASGELGKVLYTSNGGSNWFNMTNAIFGTSNVYSVHGIDPTTAIVVCNNSGGKVFKTTNRGLSWQTLFSKANVTFSDIQFVNSTTGFVFGNPVANQFYIIKTVNGGNSFDTVSVTRPPSPNPNSQIIPNCTHLLQPGVGGPVIIWFGTSTGHVFYSTNTGTSWNFSIPAANISVQSLTFSSPLNGLCGGDDPYMSINGGTGWIFQGSYPNTGRYYSFENIAGQYFYSSGPGIYRSTNNASSFSLQFTNVSKEDFRDLSFVLTPNDQSLSVIHGWGVTGDGVIAHYSDPIGIIPISTNIPEKFSLSQNYPNPFNPVTLITFDIAEKSDAKLEVTDILGKIVKVLHQGIVDAGSYKTEFDGSDLPSGIYFYRLSAGENILTKKMMLIR